jgi:hypothetical protein
MMPTPTTGAAAVLDITTAEPPTRTKYTSERVLAVDTKRDAGATLLPRVGKGKAGSVHGNCHCKVPSASDY